MMKPTAPPPPPAPPAPPVVAPLAISAKAQQAVNLLRTGTRSVAALNAIGITTKVDWNDVLATVRWDYEAAFDMETVVQNLYNGAT